jgi:ABC-type Mn2+/Zn2+ transport system permease subunit
MNQIDAVTPAPPSRSGTTKPRDTSTSPSLLSLFAPMLIAGAALGIAGGVGATLILLRRESLVALAMPQSSPSGRLSAFATINPRSPALLAAAVAVIFIVAPPAAR